MLSFCTVLLMQVKASLAEGVMEQTYALCSQCFSSRSFCTVLLMHEKASSAEVVKEQRYVFCSQCFSSRTVPISSSFS